MKNILTSLITGYFVISCMTISAQETIVLETSKDAMIRYFGISGDPTNYGNYQYTSISAWTNGGTYVVHRSLLDFDLSDLPNDSILSASLLLFSDIYSTFYPNGHEYLFGWPDNACMIQRITEPWMEDKVHWAIRPDVSFDSEIYVPPSNNNFQDYEIDVTELVQDMISDPVNSHGFLIKLRVEDYYSRMLFASSDNQTKEFQPKLSVEYLTTKINEPAIDSRFRIYPNPASDICTLILDNKENDKPYIVRISNSIGQIVKRYDNVLTNRIKLYVNSLDEGIYTVSVYKNNALIGTSALVIH